MTQPSLYDESELMNRLKARDQAALGELYDRYSSLVYGLAFHILGTDAGLAEEATQDIFLKVWNQAESWDPAKGKLATWLLTITRYSAIDTLRRERRRPPLSGVDLDEMAEALGQPALVDDPLWQDGQQIRKLVRQLAPEQLQVIELAFFGGMSHNQIAEHLTMPLGTVKTRLRAGLQRLRDLWAEATRP